MQFFSVFQTHTHIYIIRFDSSRWGKLYEKSDNVGKMSFTHEIFINTEVVK